MLLANYTAGRSNFNGGYENIRFANPSVSLAAGTSIIGGYSLGSANNTTFTDNKILQVFCTSAKYAVSSDIDLMAACCQENQNSFSGNCCANASLGNCGGKLYAASFAVDWRFAKRSDAYAAVMCSQVDNGPANGSSSIECRSHGRRAIPS